MTSDPQTAAAIAQAGAAKVQANAAVAQAAAALILIIATVVSAVATWLQNSRAERNSERRAAASEESAARRALEAEERADRRLHRQDVKERVGRIEAAVDIVRLMSSLLGALQERTESSLKTLDDLDAAGATNIEPTRDMWRHLADFTRTHISGLHLPVPTPPKLLLLKEQVVVTITPTTELIESKSIKDLRSTLSNTLPLIKKASEDLGSYKSELDAAKSSLLSSRKSETT